MQQYCHCVATLYAMPHYLVKLTELGTIWDRGYAMPLLFKNMCQVVFFYTPSSKKVGNILVSACHPCVNPCVHSNIWISHQNIADPYFVSCRNYLPVWIYTPVKGLECNFVRLISRKVLKLRVSN